MKRERVSNCEWGDSRVKRRTQSRYLTFLPKRFAQTPGTVAVRGKDLMAALRQGVAEAEAGKSITNLRAGGQRDRIISPESPANRTVAINVPSHLTGSLERVNNAPAPSLNGCHAVPDSTALARSLRRLAGDTTDCPRGADCGGLCRNSHSLQDGHSSGSGLCGAATGECLSHCRVTPVRAGRRLGLRLRQFDR